MNECVMDELMNKDLDENECAWLQEGCLSGWINIGINLVSYKNSEQNLK